MRLIYDIKLLTIKPVTKPKLWCREIISRSTTQILPLVLGKDEALFYKDGKGHSHALK